MAPKRSVSSFDLMTLTIEPKPKVSGGDKKKLKQLIRRADVLAIGKDAKLHHTIGVAEEEHTAFETADKLFVVFSPNGEMEIRTSDFDESKARTVDKLIEQYISIVTKELRRKITYEGRAMLHLITKNKKLKNLLKVGLQSAVSPYLKEKLGEKIRVVTLTAILETNLAINFIMPNDIDFFSRIEIPTGARSKNVIGESFVKSFEWLNRVSKEA